MNSMANDTRRQTKTPLAPATKGLKEIMQKLGSLNSRHEALVRRVDELEVRIIAIITLLSVRRTTSSTETHKLKLI